MFHLRTELQQKLQLDLKTSIAQICQKINLSGNLTIKDVNKPHSTRQVPFPQQATLLRQGAKAALPKHRNTHREAAKWRRQRNMPKWKNRTNLQETN